MEQHLFPYCSGLSGPHRARNAERLDVCCESQACRLGAPGVTGRSDSGFCQRFQQDSDLRNLGQDLVVGGGYRGDL
jgi:hypothetical protein